MFDDATKMQFENALASRTLKKLSDQMVAEGLSQVVIYDLFDSFREFLSDAKQEADEEQVCCSLESIVGWCSPGARCCSCIGR